MKHLKRLYEEKTLPEEMYHRLLEKALDVTAPRAPKEDNASAAMREYLEKQATRAEPEWKQKMLTVSKAYEGHKKMAGDPDVQKLLQAMYKEKVESHLISQSDAAVLTTLLFTGDLHLGAVILAILLLRIPPSDQLRYYNNIVQTRMDDVSRTSYEEKISKLSVPLFDVSCSAQNELILTQDTTMEGGAALLEDDMRVYGKHKGILSGGGFVRVYNEEGAQTGYADMAEVEGALNGIQAELESVRRSNEELRRALKSQPSRLPGGRGRGRGGVSTNGYQNRRSHQQQGYYRGGSDDVPVYQAEQPKNQQGLSTGNEHS